MANEEHLRLLKSGVEKWNEWRDVNPDIQPDLSWEDLRGMKLKKAQLHNVDFTGTDIRSTNFTLADLENANFTKAKAGIRGRSIGGALIVPLFINLFSTFLLIWPGIILYIISDSFFKTIPFEVKPQWQINLIMSIFGLLSIIFAIAISRKKFNLAAFVTYSSAAVLIPVSVILIFTYFGSEKGFVALAINNAWVSTMTFSIIAFIFVSETLALIVAQLLSMALLAVAPFAGMASVSISATFSLAFIWAFSFGFYYLGAFSFATAAAGVAAGIPAVLLSWYIAFRAFNEDMQFLGLRKGRYR